MRGYVSNAGASTTAPNVRPPEHYLPSTERDGIALNILRLDPLGRHGSPDVSSVSDLRRLWTTLDAAAKSHTKLPATLLPLSASRAEIEKLERDAKNSGNRFADFQMRSDFSRGDALAPGSVFAQHTLLIAIGNLINMGALLSGEE